MSDIDKLRELGLLPDGVNFMFTAWAKSQRRQDDYEQACEALATVAVEQANEVKRAESDMLEAFDGWAKEKARADEAEALNNGHLEGISRDGGPSLDEQRSAWDKQR